VHVQHTNSIVIMNWARLSRARARATHELNCDHELGWALTRTCTCNTQLSWACMAVGGESHACPQLNGLHREHAVAPEVNPHAVPQKRPVRPQLRSDEDRPQPPNPSRHGQQPQARSCGDAGQNQDVEILAIDHGCNRGAVSLNTPVLFERPGLSDRNDSNDKLSRSP
jgi:hypothetical protein